MKSINKSKQKCWEATYSPGHVHFVTRFTVKLDVSVILVQLRQQSRTAVDRGKQHQRQQS
jgi:REP element-mobilizing transposase RayT